MSDDKTKIGANFGQMLRASIGAGEVPGVSYNAGQGGWFRLPMQTSALVAGDEAPGRELVDTALTWLAGDSLDSPVMSRIRLTPTSQTRGKLVVGAALPTTSMQGERLTAALGRGVAFPTNPAPVAGDLWRFTSAVTGIVATDEDGGAITEASAGQTFRFDGTAWARTAGLFREEEFELSSTVEAKSEISRQLLVQAGDSVQDDVLEAHRIALADRLLVQILAGDGTANNLSGIVNATGIGSATYMLADRGGDGAFVDGEIAVEDGGGRPSGMCWALGTDLSTSARKTAIEPGASRRVLEQGQLVLSGLPAQRISEGLAATTGLLADWSLIYVPILSELVVVTDVITNVGDVRITSRLACGDPIVAHPATVYALTQA